MTVAEIADLERVVADYLRAEGVSRARSTKPDEDDRATSWVRIIRLDAGDGGEADHLIDGMLQLDCYAGEDGGQREAEALGRQVRRLLKALKGTTQSGVVFGRVRFIGHARIPDDDIEPARERVILTALLVHHVLPEGS